VNPETVIGLCLFVLIVALGAIRWLDCVDKDLERQDKEDCKRW